MRDTLRLLLFDDSRSFPILIDDQSVSFKPVFYFPFSVFRL